jgi:hypothetical protein
LNYKFQVEEVDYMMEQTQEHMRYLDIECPPLGGDARHLKSSKYPFIDYDILSDEEDEPENSKRELHCLQCYF